MSFLKRIFKYPHNKKNKKPIECVYAGPKMKEPPLDKVYAGPSPVDESQFNEVYAGPEYFEKRKDAPMECVYAGPEIIEKEDIKLLYICPECGCEFDADLDKCPKCGKKR